MHFSIPDTSALKDDGGTSYTSFNVHINGVFHCSVRYSLLNAFNEELKKEFGATVLPPFPPKKLFGMTPEKLEERRLMLERYVQIVSQEPRIANSDIFNGFLLKAQQETQKETSEAVTLDVFLMNGYKITVKIMSTDQTEDVLETVASQLELPEEFTYYFTLYLVRKEEDGDNSKSLVEMLD
ncbi:sorting nexin-17 [Mytilus galloprovincialis]|uniref:Sorting nexin-17 n=1 Tax=Mytilus galloprovincialis TaxID=29158 RepID=A0A8B6GK07_MYTGA|nr:sorting nexin-17 [Mytilus galloprovincialis]